MTERERAAAHFAIVKHKDQMYGENVPYIHHLKDAVAVLARFGFDSEDLRIIVWLHDTVEDTTATVEEIEKEFGPFVADVVWRVTNEEGVNRKERHLKTYPKIQESDDALTAKLSDRIANVEYSIEHGSDQLSMYRKEYPDFKSKLYKPGKHDAMWRHLDFLIGSAA